MTDPRWHAVESFVDAHLIPDDPTLTDALAASDAGGLPAIQVSPAQGKLLHLLARSIGARHVLEMGTLGGYSTIWLARALPSDGRVVTLEADAHHAEVARANLARAGVGDRVDVRVGRALDTLPALAAASPAPFDLTFIDADKANIPAYFDWAVRLSRPGGVIIVDNVVRDGAVADAASDDPNVRGVRTLIERLATDSRVDATAIQTVGAKGYDGFVLAVVTRH